MVDVVDLKGQYGDDMPFGVASTPETYERILAAFPHALIEDPRLTPELRETLRGHEDRVTWDAPIHSVDDILAREWAPKTVNMKPSRFGPLSRLFAAYDHIAATGWAPTPVGRPSWDRGAARCSTWHRSSTRTPPTTSRPRATTTRPAAGDLPGTPLPVAATPTGFRWGE